MKIFVNKDIEITEGAKASPTTIIASNKVDVRKIKINDTIKVAQSE